jgi:hypothetical protein
LFSIAAREKKDNFAFRFSGYVDIKEAREYTFQATSDDGSKLFFRFMFIFYSYWLWGARPLCLALEGQKTSLVRFWRMT